MFIKTNMSEVFYTSFNLFRIVVLILQQASVTHNRFGKSLITK